MSALHITMYDELNQKEAKIDWLLLAAIAGLMLIGVAFVFSASTASDPNSKYWLKQLMAYGLGLVLAAGLCCIRYDTLSRFSIVAYWLSIVLLVALIPFGST